MQVTEGLNILRHRLNDELSFVYSDAELLRYINLAIKGEGNRLVLSSTPWMVKTLSLAAAGADIPGDFHSLLPGEPAFMEGAKIFPVDPGLNGNVRYYHIPGSVDIAGDIPFPSPYAHNVVNTAFEMAAMRTGYDVSLEERLHAKMSGLSSSAGKKDEE